MPQADLQQLRITIERYLKYDVPSFRQATFYFFLGERVRICGETSGINCLLVAWKKATLKRQFFDTLHSCLVDRSGEEISADLPSAAKSDREGRARDPSA